MGFDSSNNPVDGRSNKTGDTEQLKERLALLNVVVDGVRVIREGWVPRVWLVRFRLLPEAPGRYVDERSLYAIKGMIRKHLASPFPFHIKILVSLRIQRLNPQSGELEENTKFRTA